MSDFVNTVDLVGDEALTNGIIDRSIRELADNSLSFIADQAFQSCNVLTKVDVPNAESIGYQSFASCSALAFADFANATSIGRYAFVTCSALKTLVLRSAVMATLEDTTTFNNTPIANGAGYIYVPSALVNSYKAASIWKTYANQFRALESYTVDGTTAGALKI